MNCTKKENNKKRNKVSDANEKQPNNAQAVSKECPSASFHPGYMLTLMVSNICWVSGVSQLCALPAPWALPASLLSGQQEKLKSP